MALTSHRPARGGPAAPYLLTASVAAFLGACVLLGGPSTPSLISFAVIAFAGTWLLCLSLYHGAFRALGELPLSARLLVGLIVALPLLQLVPLPPSVWQAFPGRDLATSILGATVGAERWRPMTLSVTDTSQAALASLWLAGLLMAVLCLPTDRLRFLMLVLIGLGSVHLMVGLVQFLSRGAVLNLYDSQHSRFLIGLFPNKNHAALFIVITGLAAFMVLRPEALRRRSMIWVAAALAVLLAASLLATFSRAGLLLGVLAAGFVALLGWRADMRRPYRIVLGGALLLVAAGLVFASTDIAQESVARFADTTEDSRPILWERSWPLVAEYFPVGGGIGPFPTLFAPTEPLEWVGPTYLNHAHNDYMEFVIEAGAVAIFLIALAYFVVIRQAVAAWRVRHRTEGRLALFGVAVLVLCALHSFVDYPLRRMAIAGVAFFALGLALRVSRSAADGSAAPPRAQGGGDVYATQPRS